MPVIDLYHKRQKRLRGELPDIYVYDDLPKKFRVQVVHVLHESVGRHDECYGSYSNNYVRGIYEYLVTTLQKELGVFRLPPTTQDALQDFVSELTNFLLNTPDHEEFLSALELICASIKRFVSDFNCRRDPESAQNSADAIDEINTRFKEHGLGYEFIDQIVRVDSQFVHGEVVKPALKLLSGPMYNGAQDEFLSAHERYLEGNHKDALTAALKALESTMKSICLKRGWHASPNDTASKLIKLCFDNGLVPPFWESHFSALRATLEAGVPTARNKLGGHGQGTVPTSVPEHLSAYVLHMTASAIVFLAESEKRLP